MLSILLKCAGMCLCVATPAIAKNIFPTPVLSGWGIVAAHRATPRRRYCRIQRQRTVWCVFADAELHAFGGNSYCDPTRHRVKNWRVVLAELRQFAHLLVRRVGLDAQFHANVL